MSARENKLSNQPIKTLLWSLSVPAIIGMTFNALYNIVDGIFVGMATQESGIAAISVVYPVQLINFALALMFGMGAASIYSRAIGAKDYEKAKKVTNTTIFVSAVVAIILSILGLMFNEQIGYMFGMEDSFKTETMNYLNVIFYGTIFLQLSVIYNNIFRAEGYAKVAMLAMMIGTLTNIILDPILIFGFDMGTKGAAIATVIGYSFSFSFLIYKQFKLNTNLSIRPHLFKFDIPIIKEVIIVGFPALVRNSVGALIAITVNNMLRSYSPNPMVSIAIYGIVSRTILFIFMPIFGVLQGMSPIVGFNFGAQKYDRAARAKTYSLRITTIYFGIAFVLLQLLAPFIMQAFGVSPETLELGAKYLRLSLLFIPLVSVQIILSGYYQALGRSKEATFIAMLRQLILLVPLVLILPLFFGEIGIWLALPISDLVSSLISFALYKKETINFNSLYLKKA